MRLAPWFGTAHDHPRDLMWPIAMLYSASIGARQGWDVSVLDGHVAAADDQSLRRRAVAFRPDVLLIDSTTTTVGLALRLATRIGSELPDCRLWAVGQHASELPEDLVFTGSPFTGVVLGEYEAALPDLLANEGRAREPGSVGPIQKVEDLDALPPLDPRGIQLERYGMYSTHVGFRRRLRWGFLNTSRGCPYECVFCSPTLRQSYGHRYRAHGAERVVEDMLRLHRDLGVSAVYLIDDIFTFDRERVIEICRGLVRRRNPVRWVFQTRPELIDPELLKLARAAGCRAVKMGIESGVDRILDLLNKKTTRARTLRAAREVREAGLYLTAYYMLGNPTETVEEMRETMRFARQVRADMIQAAFHTPYPGSPSYEQYGQGGTQYERLGHYHPPPMELSSVDGATLKQLQRRFYLGYHLSPPILWNYLTRRAPYRLWNRDELALIARSLRFLLSSSGEATGTQAGE